MEKRIFDLSAKEHPSITSGAAASAQEELQKASVQTGRNSLHALWLTARL